MTMWFCSPSVERKQNKCKKCGKVNPPEVVICIDCGTKLSVLPPSPGQPDIGIYKTINSQPYKNKN